MKKIRHPGKYPLYDAENNINDECWDQIDSQSFKVRAGKNYKSNGLKQKSKDAFYKTVAVDIFNSEKGLKNFGALIDFDYLDRKFEEENSKFAPKDIKGKPLSHSNITNAADDAIKRSISSNQEIGDSSSRDFKISKSFFSEANINLATEPNSNLKLTAKPTAKMKLPTWFVISITVPLEAKSFLGSKKDEKSNVCVLYGQIQHKIIEKAEREKNPSLILLKHFVFNQETLTSPDLPIRKRFKVIAKTLNAETINFPKIVRSLLKKFNGKPFLARTSSSFFLGESYFEVNVDMNKFGYLSQTGLSGIRPYLQSFDFGFGFVVQSETDEEMPEQIIMCVKFIKIKLSEKMCKL
ncbi:hypothetical protein MHBO_001031 [Bonamia ostreae]|uniref:Protein ENHANCED DISEASE RESISTANCE 2 C-terminal domain-containing protein n=1 Tax=Bonamia ostreae TaxID=126728 RepID=A0ABV2AHL3_9EUKA